jgi:hypothetical protein
VKFGARVQKTLDKLRMAEIALQSAGKVDGVVKTTLGVGLLLWGLFFPEAGMGEGYYDKALLPGLGRLILGGLSIRSGIRSLQKAATHAASGVRWSAEAGLDLDPRLRRYGGADL